MNSISSRRILFALACLVILALGWLWQSSSTPGIPAASSTVAAIPRASIEPPASSPTSATPMASASTPQLALSQAHSIVPPTIHSPVQAPLKPENATQVSTVKDFGNLRFATGYADGVALVQEKLGVGLATKFITDPDKAEVLQPLAQYNLANRNQIIQGAGLEIAKPAGFIYLVEEGGKQVSFAEARALAKGQIDVSPSFGGTNESVVTALEAVAAIDQVKTGLFEARLLILPTGPPLPGRDRVIWLKSETDGTDLIYPLDAYKLPKIQAGKLYSGEDFLNTLYPQRMKIQQAAAAP
jgi:hypothetical protein